MDETGQGTADAKTLKTAISRTPIFSRSFRGFHEWLSEILPLIRPKTIMTSTVATVEDPFTKCLVIATIKTFEELKRPDQPVITIVARIMNR